MSWESCIILLNSDSTGSVYTGDIVTGSVVLEFKQEQRIQHISFEVIGISKARWSRSAPTVPFIKIYSQTDTVLNYTIDVFDELDGKPVKPCVKTFQFHFALPDDLPSSFESSIAKVHYYIKIVGKAVSKFKKQKIVPFLIHANINLNHIENYLTPTSSESQKKFWNSDKFSMTFKTYKGFSPKQYIPFEIIVVNEKKVKLSKIKVILIQKLQYNVFSGYANEEKEVCLVEYKKISNTVTEKCIFGMEIPHTVPSSIHMSKPMIEISYCLRVQVIFSFHTPLYDDVPVTVSTIPVIHSDFEEIIHDKQ